MNRFTFERFYRRNHKTLWAIGLLLGLYFSFNQPRVNPDTQVVAYGFLLFIVSLFMLMTEGKGKV